MDSGIVQKGIFVSAPRSSGSAHSRGVRSKEGHRLESSVPRYSTKGKTMAHSDILSQPDRGLSPRPRPCSPYSRCATTGPEMPLARRLRHLEGRLRRRRPKVALLLPGRRFTFPRGTVLERCRKLLLVGFPSSSLCATTSPSSARATVRRHPQDGLQVAAPRLRYGIRLPGLDRATPTVWVDETYINSTDLS